jgi:hypothetical protein
MNRNGLHGLLLTVALLAAVALGAVEQAAGRPERNVFWPVEYKPGPDGVATGDATAPTTPPGPVRPPPPPADWDGAQGSVKISGISRTNDGKAIALVDGSLYQVGDVLVVTHKGRAYRFLIRKIDEEGLELRRLDPEHKADADPVPPAPNNKEDTP